jgi:hypothetical protein
MKPSLKQLLLTTAIAATVVPVAAAQDNPFARGRYVDVTERSQAEFDPQPVRAGGFDIISSVGVAAEYNDNILATPANEISDTILRATPRLRARSTWSVHELEAGAEVTHREYTDNGDESSTDYNVFVNGRIDVTRDFQFRLGADTAHITEERYAAASFGVNEAAQFDRSAVYAQALYRNDRIQIEGTVGASDEQFDQLAQQLIRDNTTTYVNGRVSYAVSPDIAFFVQARRSELDYDDPDRDGTRTTMDAGVNFELAAPIRGEIAIGNFSEERDVPTYGDVEGLNIAGNVKWFPTDLTTVTFIANRGVVDPGLATSAAAINTAYGIRVDHELLRNLLLFGNIRQENNAYEGSVIDRDDDALSLALGGAYKLNPNMHLEFALTTRSQDSSGADAGPDLDVNTISAGIRFFP